MRLLAGCELSIETEASGAVQAMLRPRSGGVRWRVNDRDGFEPVHAFAEYTDGFGNRCQRFTLPEGLTRLQVQSVVDTAPDLPVAPMAPANDPAALPAETLQFLLPSRYCPSDRAPMWRQALAPRRSAPGSTAI